MSKVFTLMALSAILLSPQLFAAQPSDNKLGYGQNDEGNQKTFKSINWLGVSLAAVPNVLRGQLGHLIPSGQGVLVTGVSELSSAFEAGIGRNDVLLSYDDQKLYSPRQLSGLIRADKAGREVRLQVVQKGQLKTINVKLGTQQRQRPSYPNWQYPPQGYSPFGMAPPRSLNPPNNFGGNSNNNRINKNNPSLAWDSFESVQVNTLPDDRYHAEISFKDKLNETKKFSFEGRREEIIEQINVQSELPADKKKALLNALNMRSDSFMNNPFLNSPSMGNPFLNHPFFQGNPFDSYLFQRNPFNDPFFQRNPFDDPFFKRDFQYDFSPRYQRKLPPAQMNRTPEDVI